MASSINVNPVAIAIEICNKQAFKTDIFSGIYPDEGTPEEIKSSWDEKVEALAIGLLEDYNLEEDHQEQVIGVVFSIALRVLAWIEYHAGTFNFTRDFCIEFLEESLFTSKGIIDHQRVKTKMSEKPLNNLQKFQLACFYCDDDNIPPLFNILSIEEKELLYNHNPERVKQPEIIKFWSYYVRNEIDALIKGDDIDKFRIKAAISSGSQLALNFCLERTNSKQSVEVDIAASILRHRMYAQRDGDMNTIDDWIIFRKERYSCNDKYWVPRSFYADMFYSLVNWLQEKDFWNQIIKERFIVATQISEREKYANLLEYFLCWPHQGRFSKLLQYPHKLPFTVLGTLLQKIFKRIEPKRGQFFYGEEKFYDYRKMFMDVWLGSGPFDRQALHETDVKNMEFLFESIFKLEKFNDKDRMLILESAPEPEKRHYMLSKTGFSVSQMLLENGKFDLFNKLVSDCFFTTERGREYKFRVISTKAIELNYFTSIKNEQWDEAEKKLRWSGYPLTHEEILTLKDILIFDDEGKKICIEFWKTDPAKADNFIHWSMLPSEERDYKMRLIFCDIGQEECRKLCIMDSDEADRFVRWCMPEDIIPKFKIYLIEKLLTEYTCMKYAFTDDTPELAEKLIRWCLPEEQIKEYKRFLGYHQFVVLPNFISAIEDIENCTDDDFPDKIFDWKPVEKMFSWSFDSDPDEEKKYKVFFLRKGRKLVIYKCIESNNWNVADRYLSWLKVDESTVRSIKKDQIGGKDKETKDLFIALLRKRENDPIFINNGGKQRVIVRFIDWFLADDGSTIKLFSEWLQSNTIYDRNLTEILCIIQCSSVEKIREYLKTF